MKKIVALPPPMALAGLNPKDVVSYKKLTSIVSLNDVLKYHRFNTMLAQSLPLFCVDNFQLVCYSEENINFVREHATEYEIVCKKDNGKESTDDFYSVSGKIHSIVDVNTETILLNIFGEGDEADNLKSFLRTIGNVYGINSMMSIDAFKTYLIS
jgi:hypothetical protein